MPGFNGTGPMGQGAATGWGRGYCNSANAGDVNRSTGNAGVYGYGRAMMRGAGGGFGRGCRGSGRRGLGMGFGGGQPLYTADPDTELTILKQQARAAQNTLDSISARIAGLEKAQE